MGGAGLGSETSSGGTRVSPGMTACFGSALWPRPCPALPTPTSPGMPSLSTTLTDRRKTTPPQERVHGEHPDTSRAIPPRCPEQPRNQTPQRPGRGLARPPELRPARSAPTANSTGREARPGAGPSGGGGEFRAPTFLGRVFWRLTLGGRGLGWKSRPRGQVWSERPSRGFSGALQRCAQRGGAERRPCDPRPHGTRLPFSRRIPWRVGAPRAPPSKRLINRVALL